MKTLYNYWVVRGEDELGDRYYLHDPEDGSTVESPDTAHPFYVRAHAKVAIDLWSKKFPKLTFKVVIRRGTMDCKSPHVDHAATPDWRLYRGEGSGANAELEAKVNRAVLGALMDFPVKP